jgi:hypothetical protein
MYILMLALIVLIPNQMNYGLAIAWGTLALQRIIDVIVHSKQLITTWKGEMSPAVLRLRVYGLPLISALGLIMVSYGVFIGRPEAIYLLVPVVAALLGTAIWNAWLLLTLAPREKD